MLFDPARHEALQAHAWRDDAVRAALQAIVRDIEQHRVTDGPCRGQWPVHPLDDEGDTPPGGFKSLYIGSAGVLWALWMLQHAGAVTLALDPVDGLAQVQAAYAAHPDGGSRLPSYLLGEAGILLVAWRMSGSPALADRLHDVVASNIDNPTNEALWGAPGTMLAAWHLWVATGEARWRALFLRNADAVWDTWLHDEAALCHLWTQQLDGKAVQYLGAGHGFAGNVYALFKGAALLDADRRQALVDRCAATLRRFALHEGDAVNWPPGTYTPRPGRPTVLMQWCHGAPGIVTALADFPPQRAAEVDALLLGAGHAVWQAGPLAKGFGVCHGTAGNALAFLTLNRRTGDALWLQRARAFALHALAQRAAQHRQHGQHRCTLWTGDAGLAVVLWQCLQGFDGLPAMDLLDCTR